MATLRSSVDQPEMAVSVVGVLRSGSRYTAPAAATDGRHFGDLPEDDAHPAKQSLTNAEDASLADAIQVHTPQLVDLWLRLGKNGPIGSGEPSAVLQTQYLSPLARLMVGALRGSATHRAVYLDERTRYLATDLDATDRVGLLRDQLARESEALHDLLGSEQLRPEAIARILQRLHRPLTRKTAQKPIRLLLVGDCIFTETRAFIQDLGWHQNIDLEFEHTYFSAAQGVFSIDDTLTSIRGFSPDLIGLSLFSFEGVPPYTALLRDAAGLSSAELNARVTSLVDLLGGALDIIRSATDAPILLHNACGLPLHGFRRRIRWLPPLSRVAQNVVNMISGKIAELGAAHENILLIDEPEIADAAGGLHKCCRPLFTSRDIPKAVFHTSHFGPVLAKHYFEVIEAYQVLGKAKVLLVDFDNTLWAGVMADGPVEHNFEAQRLLKRLKEAGILLVALSKNDPSNIRWSEMALTADDFVLHKIGWQPKPEGVSQAISELDLAATSFVLLDDNPAERALVTEQVPGVRALDPTQPDSWRALERWLAFPSTKATEEARRRTELYREAAERRRSMEGVHDYARMMRSLELRLGFRRAKTSDLERLLELSQRTNQFNTTTRRRSAAEIKRLLSSDSHGVYVATLADRFGKLGVIAVAVVERASDQRVIFDSVIMSCRAMGYGVEQALLRKVIDNEPAASYIGIFVPTERNGPAAELFQANGFRRSDLDRWVLEDSNLAPVVPPWFTDER
jgi:FkbH-like protein